MTRRTLLALLPAAFLAACSESIVAVSGKQVDPSPTGDYVRETLSDEALDFVASLDQVATNPDGSFVQSDPPGLPPGTIRSGTLQRSTGAFDVTLSLPPGYYLRAIEDAGTLVFDSMGRSQSASYQETRQYGGASQHFSAAFTVAGPTLTLHAVDLDLGTRFDGTVTSDFDRLEVQETHQRPNVYLEQITETLWSKAPNPYLEQEWTRDELATDVSPDRTGYFVQNRDLSGYGAFQDYFAHGITQTQTIVQTTSGAYTVSLVYEDPATKVSPDGTGFFSINADYSGSGRYDQGYDDGSHLHQDWTYSADGTSRSGFTFDDASTTWTPDSDGLTCYAANGSGRGGWHVDGPAGPSETCQFQFGDTGAITSLTCSPAVQTLTCP